MVDLTFEKQSVQIKYWMGMGMLRKGFEWKSRRIKLRFVGEEDGGDFFEKYIK